MVSTNRTSKQNPLKITLKNIERYAQRDITNYDNSWTDLVQILRFNTHQRIPNVKARSIDPDRSHK